MEKIYNSLIEICNKGLFEQTYSVYLKNKVKVGENENGDIYCTYIDRSFNPYYDVDHLTINVIFNRSDCDLYGFTYDFTFYTYEDINNPQPVGERFEFENFKLYDNALELILNELEKNGDEWIAHQRELRIKCRDFHRRALRHYDNKTSFTWDEQIEWLKLKIEDRQLHYHRPLEHNPDLKTLNRMNKLGEEKYREEQKRMSKIAKEIWDKIKAEENEK